MHIPSSRPVALRREVARHNRGVLAALSPAQRTYVQDNYASVLAEGRRLDVATPAGNGGQPVLVFQPATLQQGLASNPGMQYAVHTHYHGDVRPADPRFLDKSTIVGGMEREWARDPNTVFVLPQTEVFGQAQGSTPIGNQFGVTAWNTVSDERETTTTALQAAGLDPQRAGLHTLSGHSSGGYPVAHVMASTAHHPDHPDMQADRILLFDTVHGEMGDPQVPMWIRDHTPIKTVYIDATMHCFTPEQARTYGWEQHTETDHFAAIQNWFDYR